MAAKRAINADSRRRQKLTAKWSLIKRRIWPNYEAFQEGRNRSTCYLKAAARLVAACRVAETKRQWQVRLSNWLSCWPCWLSSTFGPPTAWSVRSSRPRLISLATPTSTTNRSRCSSRCCSNRVDAAKRTRVGFKLPGDRRPRMTIGSGATDEPRPALRLASFALLCFRTRNSAVNLSATYFSFCSFCSLILLRVVRHRDCCLLR